MKNAELQVLSAYPTAGTNKIMLFANTGGYVLKKNSAGVELLVAGDFSGTALDNTAIRTGTASYILSGTLFGTAQGALFSTGLGCPQKWLPVNVAGTIMAIPAYSLL